MTAGPRTLFGTVATLTGAGEREQTVFTPLPVLSVVRGAFGGRIQYDPCHGHPGIVLTKLGREAAKVKELPESSAVQVQWGMAVEVESQVDAVEWTDTRGLIDDWRTGTFANPPYKTLAEWLEMSLKQPTNHILLIPVRPSRKWWRAFAREAEIVYLNPVKFVGHDQSFPAPVCLAHRNSHQPGKLAELCSTLGIGEAL